VAKNFNAAINAETVFEDNLEEIRKTAQSLDRINPNNSSYVLHYVRNCTGSMVFTYDFYGAYSTTSNKRFTMNLATGKRIMIDDVFERSDLETLAKRCDTILRKRITTKIQQESDAETKTYAHEEIARLFEKITANDLTMLDVSNDGVTLFYRGDEGIGFPHVSQALEPDNSFTFSFAELKGMIKPSCPLAAEAQYQVSATTK
jgi:hypothetical protein